MLKRRGRRRQHAAITLPASIFQRLRSVGIPDLALARAIGVSRSTIQRASAGHSWEVNLSADELARLRAFAEARLAAAEVAVAALAASKTQFELFAS